ncbi:T6SS immunity protein Tdi1 domain-containing protein [Terribacillus saccharophilus]|uniref:T6SS immunity protein Tdi1 domain-containing protein n=1 Tax=Terribacillus saccharophilus TaxID=361277 RepID=UPI002989F608|nr:T6SS immunity protein Tdi1 domain-containing protein [Terribacillus saccharophilus]MCM3225728.1 DUF1851 domain-containing protein [Terribacillus saccharophilus]
MQNKIQILSDFILEEAVSPSVIDEYKDIIPTQVINIWKEYGFGSALQGYIKIINPHRLNDLIEEVYIRHQEAIPLFVTSMGDVIVWERNRYLNLLNFRKNRVDIIAAGFDFFLDDLNDKSFLIEELDWLPYPQAIEIHGIPLFDECYAYVPLLGLGGPETIENLKRVKFREHIYLSTQVLGPIS